MATAVFFTLFAALTLASAVMVIAAKNPVHSVFFLILSFFNSAGLFVLMGAEFIAMLLVVVYVGAVAVLLLFVVMMLDVNYGSINEGVKRNLPLGLVVGGILLAELVLILATPETAVGVQDAGGVPHAGGLGSNIAQIGAVLYTEYIFVFQLAGLILLVAMIGAITLTMRQREGVKRQNITAQNTRRRADSVALISVASGESPKPILPQTAPPRKGIR